VDLGEFVVEMGAIYRAFAFVNGLRFEGDCGLLEVEGDWRFVRRSASFAFEGKLKFWLVIIHVALGIKFWKIFLYFDLAGANPTKITICGLISLQGKCKDSLVDLFF
jgi:hypothetical protein